MFAVADAPDPAIAWNVILTIGLLLNMGVSILAISRGNRTQRRDVSIIDDFVARADYDKHSIQNREDHNKIFDQIRESERLIEEKILNAERLADEKITNAVGVFNQKLQNLPSEIVALLRNAGVIK